MSKPEVSIIMNCLNGEKDLRETLESVRSQTFKDYEIIFWDNCSTDKSAEIAKASKLPLRYFRGESTVPLGAARNLAIKKAIGKYIAFLDCDDLWEPEKLASQVELFRSNPHVGLVCTDTIIFDGSRELSDIFTQSPPARGMAFDALMARQWISMSSAIASMEALNSIKDENGNWFDESLNVCEEADVFYRLAHDWDLDYVDRPLTRWRVHGANTTFRKFGQFAEETRKILAKHRRLYPNYDREHKDTVALLTRRAAFQEGIALWRAGDGRKARKVIAPFIGTSPKYRLFWGASFLPGLFFDFFSRLYFALPAALRRQK